MIILKHLRHSSRQFTLLRNLYSFSQHTRNHYQTLNLSPQASFEEVKKKFRQLSKIYHPDYYKGTDNKFHDIQKAYKVLSEFKTRKQHDLSIGISKSVWESQQFKLQSDKFQNQLFDEVLTGSAKGKSGYEGKTLEQKLKDRFENQIDGEMTTGEKIKAVIWPFLGFGVFWITWNVFQSIIINYQGSQSHQVNSYIGQKKLSAIPIKIG